MGLKLEKFKVYVTEEVRWTYMVEAESEDQAQKIVDSGKVPPDDYEGRNQKIEVKKVKE